jgi:hypothetical protein
MNRYSVEHKIDLIPEAGIVNKRNYPMDTKKECIKLVKNGVL